MKRISVVLVLCLFALSACNKGAHTYSKVILKHPETHDVETCSVSQWKTEAAYEKSEACIQKLKDQGYIVWGER